MKVGWPGKGWGGGSNPGVFCFNALVANLFFGPKSQGFLSYQNLCAYLEQLRTHDSTTIFVSRNIHSTPIQQQQLLLFVLVVIFVEVLEVPFPITPWESSDLLTNSNTHPV